MRRLNPAATGLALSLALAVATAHAADNPPPLPYGALQYPEAEHKIVVAPRTIRLLDEAAQQEKDPIRRAQLATDLGKCPAPESRDALKRMLSDAEPVVRAAAVRSIVVLGVQDAADAIAKLAGDASPVVRREAVLAKIESVVLKGLDDPDLDVRIAALASSTSDATDQAIAKRLPSLTPPLQAVACRGLAAHKAASAAPAVATLLASDNLVARVAAIESLASLKAITRQQIEQQLTHKHPSVRTAAILATKSLASADERLAIATNVLADADLPVRVPAAEILGELGKVESLDPLLAQLGAGYEPLRLNARAALVTLVQKNDAIRQPLATKSAALLGDTNAPRRVDGSFILGALASHEGFDKHVELLKDADWRVVEQAARGLGTIGDPAAGDPLVKTYERVISKEATAPGTVQEQARLNAGEQAILSAGKLHHTPILEATKGILPNKKDSPFFRGAALWALGVTGTPEQITAGARPLLGRVNDPEESQNVIVEAIRALGNGGVKPMLSSLRSLEQNQGNFDFAFAAHQSIDRINGTNTPMAPAPIIDEPEVSIRDLTPAAK